MKKTGCHFFFFFLVIGISLIHAPSVWGKQRTRTQKVESEAGLNIPEWGIAVDGLYDKRLDNLVAGYKILNVIVTNRSGKNISFDPRKDQWHVRDSVGKTHKAITHLKIGDRRVWEALPDALKKKLEYPQLVHNGNMAKIDLFFPFHADLDNFRSLEWRSSFFKKSFVILSTGDRETELQSPSADSLKTPSVEKSHQKYEGESPARAIPPRFDPSLDDLSAPDDETLPDNNPPPDEPPSN